MASELPIPRPALCRRFGTVGLALSLGVVSTVDVHAAMNQPDDLLLSSRAPTPSRESSVSPAAAFVRALFFTYQKLMGPSKGTRCPMYPSCSEYARLQVAARGLAVGILAAGDRIHRCGHDLHYYDRVLLPYGEAREDRPD